MDESQWLACENPNPMLEFLRGTATGWKLRRCICACFRHCGAHESGVVPRVVSQLSGEAIEFVEQFGAQALPSGRAWALRDELVRAGQISSSTEAGSYVTVGSNILSDPCTIDGAIWALRACRRLAAYRAARSSFDPANRAAFAAEPREQARIVRDVFGNPFRPVAFYPAWHTDTVVSLARQMNGSHDFGAMPILADALQDAGCETEAILNHCRVNEPHSRGCWVVDLVLWNG